MWISKAILIGPAIGAAFLLLFAAVGALPNASSHGLGAAIFTPDPSGDELNDSGTAIFTPDPSGDELNDRVFK